MRIETVEIRKRDKIEIWDAIVTEDKEENNKTKIRISRKIAKKIKENIEYKSIITIIPCLFIKERNLVIDKEERDLLIMIPGSVNNIFPEKSAKIIAKDKKHSIIVKKNDQSEILISYTTTEDKNKIALINHDYYIKETISPIILNESTMKAIKRLSIMDSFKINMTKEERKIKECLLRGKIFLLSEEIIIYGSKYSSKALIFENAEIFPVKVPSDQKILTSGNKKFLYITASKDSKEIDPKKESLYSSPNSKYYEVRLTTYHYKDKLHPESKEEIEKMIDSGLITESLLIDITDIPNDKINDIKIKIKEWKYKSISHYSHNENDFSSIWDLELIEEKEVHLNDLIGNKKMTCKELIES